MMNSAASPQSKLYSIIVENLDNIGANLILRQRGLWAETAGHDYIQSLAFAEDVETIKLSVTGSYYAVCCIAAVGIILLCDVICTNLSP
jgi:DNA mismatch repair protein MSH4